MINNEGFENGQASPIHETAINLSIPKETVEGLLNSAMEKLGRDKKLAELL